MRSSSIVSTTSSTAPLDRALHLLAQADAHVLDLGRLAGDHDHLARPGAERLHEAQHGLRVHRVRVDHLAVLDPGLDVLLARLHHVERPGLAALPADVHQHQRVVAAHHLVGEVEAAGAEVEDRRALGQLARLEALYHLAAEAVVPAATRCRSPATRIRFTRSSPPPRGGRTTGSARSRAGSPGPGSSTLTPRWMLAVVVAVDPLDRHRAPVEHARLQVGARARAARRRGRRAGRRRRRPRPRGRPRVGVAHGRRTARGGSS